jgi:serine/threonine-protein kinase
MGEVWRAQHMTLGTDVALKLVDTAGRADAAETLARFGLEARAAAQLKSPHVVSILDHGVDGSVAFMAMELLDGESLEHRLARRGRLTPSETAHVLREMARGVDRAHAAGIVHRDLKPPNVFLARVDQTEVVKVLDFGIAKVLGAAADAHLVTQAGYVLGTPAYMSPEQVLGRAVDPRADLWSMAVIAFECVTGARPFEGETLGQLFMAVCSGPMPIPSQVAASTPGSRGPRTAIRQAASRAPARWRRRSGRCSRRAAWGSPRSPPWRCRSLGRHRARARAAPGRAKRGPQRASSPRDERRRSRSSPASWSRLSSPSARSAPFARSPRSARARPRRPPPSRPRRPRGPRPYRRRRTPVLHPR